MEYNKEWEYGTPVDCDCENNFIHVDCGCKSKEVCECENILLEISKLKTEDIVLQREIDEISGASISGVTEEQMNAAISSAKTEIEGEIPTVPTSNTAFTNDAGYITGVDLSNYATKSEIPTSASQLTNDSGYITSQSLSGYVTLDELGDYIMSLRSEINTLRQQVSGCCEIPPTPTPTGDTDCFVRIKYTQGEDFVITCEESYIGNLESFYLPNIYTRPDATAVTVGDCTAQIGQTCFEDYFQLQTVYIGSACSSIRLEAFYGCSALTTVTITAATPPTLVGNNTFEGCTSLAHIYVPAESVNGYKTARYWSTYSDIIEAIA